MHTATIRPSFSGQQPSWLFVRMAVFEFGMFRQYALSLTLAPGRWDGIDDAQHEGELRNIAELLTGPNVSPEMRAHFEAWCDSLLAITMRNILRVCLQQQQRAAGGQ